MLKAIPTEYKGCCFRSRLEARWAVFFDACGVKWEYEPEAFQLYDGKYYLPDFLLHNVVCQHDTQYEKFNEFWVEVKGQMTESDAEKIKKFSTDAPIVIFTYIPKGNRFYDIAKNINEFAVGCMDDLEVEPYEDNDIYAFPFNFSPIFGEAAPAFPCIDTDGRFSLFSKKYLEYVDTSTTALAYHLAQQAVFENGKVIFKNERLLNSVKQNSRLSKVLSQL